MNTATPLHDMTLDHVSSLFTVSPCFSEHQPPHHKRRFEKTLFDTYSQMGFSSISCIKWLNNQTFKDAPLLTLSNTPKDFASIYCDKNLFLVDPVIRMVEENTSNSSCFGRLSQALDRAIDIPLGETQKQKNLYLNNLLELTHHMRSHNLVDGYFLANADETSTTLIIATVDNDFIEDPSKLVFSILWGSLSLIDRKFSELQHCPSCRNPVRKLSGKELSLTKSEQRVLITFLKNNNASLSEIAHKYGSSLDTINFHLRNLREKFELHGASGYVLAYNAKTIGLI